MAREDRILSQSEIDFLLRKVLPKSDAPAAKEEPAPVEPSEPAVETEELEVEHGKPTVEPEEAPVKNVKTVLFKTDGSIESEEATPAELVTDSIKRTEYEPEAAEPPHSVGPVETGKQEYTPDGADDLKKKIADLTAEVNKLSAALQAVSQLEEKVRQLEAVVKNAPESTRTLKNRIDQISAALEAGEANKSDYGLLEAFRCSHCHTKGNVAIYIKCTSCGKENWMGWWPEKGKK
jgi:hypothetical protein